MTSPVRIRVSRAILFSAVTVIAPWIVLALLNFARMPWLGDAAGLVVPASGVAAAIAAVAVVVRARRRGAVPTLAVAGAAALSTLLACAVVLGAVSAASSWSATLSVQTTATLLMSALSGLVAAFALVPAWMACARLAAPLIAPLAVVRRPRLGASIVLFASVAAISLGIWIASGGAVSGKEPYLAWGGLTYALAWGALGVSFLAVGSLVHSPASHQTSGPLAAAG